VDVGSSILCTEFDGAGGLFARILGRMELYGEQREQ
jgi:hypothetical protein